MDKTTLPEMYHELMRAPSIITPSYCAVCGHYPANNQHHMVRRNAGELYVQGHKLPKPTITLCGSGVCGCHGLAHQNRLHFRWVPELKETQDSAGTHFYQSGHLEFILFDKPTDYLTALGMDGWRPLPKWSDFYESIAS